MSDEVKCGCGAPMENGGSVGWYCTLGWGCGAPLLLPRSKTDAELEARIAELEGHLRWIRSEAQTVCNHGPDVRAICNRADYALGKM